MDYQTARQMFGLPELMDVSSVLVIEPHPDDNEVGAGGTVKRWCDQGTRVTYLTVTDGRAGAEVQSAYGTTASSSPNAVVTMADMVRIRRAERQDANRILGVEESYNLGFEDGGNWSEYQLMSTLVALIRQFRPEVVMTVDPWTPYESHPDHVKTGKAVAAALIYAKNRVMFRDQGEPCAVPQAAFYGSAYPNVYIDVTDTWEDKLKAMKAHVSQFDIPESPMLSQYFTGEAERLYRDHLGERSDGRAEAFKALISMQLHFFPDAVRS